jgi:IS30 family transposase
MKGRKVGTTEVTIEEIQKIKTLTEQNRTRREIANSIDRSLDTVWRYQKKFGLV